MQWPLDQWCELDIEQVNASAVLEMWVYWVSVKQKWLICMFPALPTGLNGHRVFLCHYSQGLKQIIIRLCQSVYWSALLCWNYTVNEVKSPKRLILCLLLIFQKPVIQLCLFICSFWANNWSTAMQSRRMKYCMSLCMLHSNHLWCL